MLFVLGGKGGIAPDLVDKGHVVGLFYLLIFNCSSNTFFLSYYHNIELA